LPIIRYRTTQALSTAINKILHPLIIITIIIIIKRQFIRRSDMASHYKGAVQCSLLVL